MTSLADVFVQGRVDTSKFGSDIKSGMSSSSVRSASEDSGKTVGGHFKTGFGTALRGFAAPIAAALGAAAVGGFLKDSISEARESQKVGAQTAAVLKSTGGAANVTAQQIGALSTAISNKSGIDDEAIQTGENLLLTFKNIRNETGKGNDIFNQATQSVTDMSAALNQPMKAGAIQLGKALNDPVKGITALSRVGVSFNDVQKKQIANFVKSGQTMKAQKIILKELSSEFGGSAAAQATAGEKAQVAFKNLEESVGTALLPVLDKLETIFVEKIVPALYTFAGFVQSTVIPAISTFVDKVKSAAEDFRAQFGDEILSVFDDIKGAFSDFLDLAGTVFDFLNQHREIVVAFAATIAVLTAGIGLVTLATTLWTAALALNPIGLVVIGLAALVAGLVYAYKNSKTFADIVNRSFSTVKTVVVDAVNVATALWRTFGSTIVSIAKQYLGGVVNIIKGYFQVISGIFQLFRDILSGNWSAVWQDLGKIVQGAFTVIKGFVQVGLAALSAPFRIAWAALGNIVVEAWKAIESTTTGALDRLWQTIRDGFANIVDFFLGFASTFVGIADKAFGWIPGIGGKLDDAAASFGKFRDSVNAYLRGIQDQSVTVSGSFSVPSSAQVAKVTAQLGGGIPAATGGLFTGGTPGKDSIHALVMPGEFIAKTTTVNREGADMFHMLNQGKASIVPHFAEGGLVLGTKTDPSGAAATASFANRVMSRVASLVGSGMSKALDTIIGSITPKAPAGSGGFGGSVASYAKDILLVLGMLGQSSSWLGAVESRMQRESGGNPTIVNKWDSNWAAGTPSVGLMQVIGPTFRAYAGPYAGIGPFEYGVSTNPMANIYAGLNYGLHRYGSMSFLGAPGGYDMGGLARGPGWMSKGPAPERVLNPRQTVAFEQAMSRNFGGSGHPMVIEGTLSIDPSGKAFIRGIARDEVNQSAAWDSTLAGANS